MKKTEATVTDAVNEQGAYVLLSATLDFLRRNDIREEWITKFAREQFGSVKSRTHVRQFRRITRAYEDMGMIMSTWYAQPRFLDEFGQPMPLSLRAGHHSIHSLVLASRVKTTISIAVELLRRSSSVRFESRDTIVPLKRIFVLRGFEVPRAAIVVERYLETLGRNSLLQEDKNATPLLERSCHVTQVNLRNIAPILRDIKGKGTAFMDSVDGEIEGQRKRKADRDATGEMGVLIFAWTRNARPIRSRPSKSKRE